MFDAKNKLANKTLDLNGRQPVSSSPPVSTLPAMGSKSVAEIMQYIGGKKNKQKAAPKKETSKVSDATTTSTASPTPQPHVEQSTKTDSKSEPTKVSNVSPSTTSPAAPQQPKSNPNKSAQKKGKKK